MSSGPVAAVRSRFACRAPAYGPADCWVVPVAPAAPVFHYIVVASVSGGPAFKLPVTVATVVACERH